MAAAKREKELIQKCNQLENEMSTRSIYPENAESYQVLQAQFKSKKQIALF
jgi:hypothetical protein